MIKLMVVLFLITHLSAFSQWEPTSWRSDYPINILAQNNLVIMQNDVFEIKISNDYGKTWIENVAGLNNEIYISSIVSMDSIFFTGTNHGIYSSSDYGKNWINKNIDIPDNFNCNFLTVTGNNIFFTIYGIGVFVSKDKGETWNSANNGLTSLLIQSFAVYGNNLFIGTDENTQMFFSSDYGENWIKRGDEKPFIRFTDYGVIDSTLYLLGSYLTDNEYSYGFCCTTDLGKTWTIKPYNSPSTDSTDYYGDFKIAGNRIYISNYNNIFYSDDLSATWTKTSIKNGEKGSVNLTITKDMIYAVFCKEYYFSTNSGQDWTPGLNSINYGVVNSIIPHEDKLYVCTTQEQYCTTFQDGIFVSSDLGNTWKGIGLEGIKVNTVAFDFNHKIYAGTDTGLYISPDNGMSWNEEKFGKYNDKNIKKIILENHKIFIVTSKFIYESEAYDYEYKWTELINKDSFEVDEEIMTVEVKNEIIIAGLNTGVFISTDIGKTWARKNNGFPVPEKYRVIGVHSIFFENNKIITGTNYGIFASTDFGENWVEKNNGISKLQDKYIKNVLVLNIKNYLLAVTYNDSIYYSSGPFDLYISYDMGESWEYCNKIIRGVNTLATFQDYIFAGAEFKYFYTTTPLILKAKLSDFGITDVEDTKSGMGTLLYPNPAGSYITLLESDTKFYSDYEIYDISGRCLIKAVQNSYRIDISALEHGSYYLRLNSPGKTATVGFLKL